MRKSLLVLGIDLAASSRRPTGLCLLSNLRVKSALGFTNEEILAAAPGDLQLVSIDAPLSLPEGRCCLRSGCGCGGPGST